MTICDFLPDGREFPVLPQDSFYYVTVYVKVKNRSAEQFKMDLHRSLGGQVHVFCKCAGDESFPLIVTGREKEEKRTCMIPNCNGKEHYVCCNDTSCQTRICNSHFEEYYKGDRVWLDPPTDEEHEILGKPKGEESHIREEGQYSGDNVTSVESETTVDRQVDVGDDWQERLYRIEEDKIGSEDEED